MDRPLAVDAGQSPRTVAPIEPFILRVRGGFCGMWTRA